MFRHLAGSVELPATQESKKDVERVGRLLLSARYKLNEDFETLVMLLVMPAGCATIDQLWGFWGETTSPNLQIWQAPSVNPKISESAWISAMAMGSWTQHALDKRHLTRTVQRLGTSACFKLHACWTCCLLPGLMQTSNKGSQRCSAGHLLHLVFSNTRLCSAFGHIFRIFRTILSHWPSLFELDGDD